MSLTEVTRIRVPVRVVNDSQGYLRRVGLKRHEGFVLWAGTQAGSLFHVLEAIIPRRVRSRWKRVSVSP